MKTSVVMTVYNGAQYLFDMMDSLKNQSREIDELLIFDDCSTDSSSLIIQNYIDQNNLRNWRLIENLVNKGWEKILLMA